MDKNKSKMMDILEEDLEKGGADLYCHDYNNVEINTDAYISLADAMRSDCISMNIMEINAWFKEWFKLSGYTNKDLSVRYDAMYLTVPACGESGWYVTSIFFAMGEPDASSYIHMTYEGYGEFTFKLDALGFLLIPSRVIHWLPNTSLQEALSDIKNIVLSSLNKLNSYPIKVCNHLEDKATSAVYCCTYLPNSGNIARDVYFLSYLGFVAFDKSKLIKKGREMEIINGYFQSIPHNFGVYEYEEETEWV